MGPSLVYQGLKSRSQNEQKLPPTLVWRAPRLKAPSHFLKFMHGIEGKVLRSMFKQQGNIGQLRNKLSVLSHH